MVSQTTVLPRGRQSKVRMAWETTFGVNPGTGFQELNTYTSDLMRTRALDADDVLGAGFANYIDDRPAAPAMEDSSAKISVPLDLLQFGYWLAAALGRVAPSGSGPYVHAFTSGNASVPTFTLERELLAAAQYDGVLAACVKDMKFNFKPGKGYNAVDIGLVGKQTLEPYASTAAGSPTVAALGHQVPNSTGIVKIAGSQVGTIIDGSITLTNDLTPEAYVGGGAFITAIMLEAISAAVDLSVRYNTDAFRAYGEVGSGILPPVQAVEFDYILGAMELAIVLPAVRFEPVGAPITNGKTITQAMKGRAEIGASTPLMQATLTNTQSTEY